MLLTIPAVLTKDEVARCRAILDQAEWVDGKVTAGHQSALAKNNMQLPEGSPAARQVGDAILNALSGNPLFVAAALPLDCDVVVELVLEVIDARSVDGGEVLHVGDIVGDLLRVAGQGAEMIDLPAHP